MSNVVSPQAFTAFPAPYRMQVVYDRLKAALSHLPDVTVTMEPLALDDSATLYPYLQYDTCRVWARRYDLTVNVQGVIQEGSFAYRAMVNDGDTPKGFRDVPMDKLDDLITHIRAVF